MSNKMDEILEAVIDVSKMIEAAKAFGDDSTAGSVKQKALANAKSQLISPFEEMCLRVIGDGDVDIFPEDGRVKVGGLYLDVYIRDDQRQRLKEELEELR